MPEWSDGVNLSPVGTDRPLALFPVRLETRFTDDGATLRIRIYPDQIHVDTFEAPLTDVEIIWGKHFWERIWLIGNDTALSRAAWAQLSERFGPHRAAWIARELEPENPGDRASAPPRFGQAFRATDSATGGAPPVGLTEMEIGAGRRYWERNWLAPGIPFPEDFQEQGSSAWKRLAERVGAGRAEAIRDALAPLNPADRPKAPPVFPERFDVTNPEVQGRQAAWTRAPHTRVLPDRWIALGHRGGERVFAVQGNSIPDPLPIGLSPDNDRELTATTLRDDPDAGWFVDFDRAEAVGMALTIRYADWGLDPGAKLDRLLVVGVKQLPPGDTLHGEDPAERPDSGARRLAELLHGHQYTEGLAFVRQGTLSNNTLAGPSGYDSADPHLATGDSIARVEAATLAAESNGVIAAGVFGIADSAFGQVAGAAAREQPDARHMNRALWQATWGYFLEMLLAEPGTLSEASIRAAQDHFVEHVRARGPVPALRIGNQPYGILPVVSLAQWKPLEGTPIDAPLVRFLRELREIWHQSLTDVPRLPGSDDPVVTLQRVLAMTPTSVSYVGRPAQRLARVPPASTPAATGSGSRTSKELAESLGLTWTPRQIQMLFASYTHVRHLTGPLVALPGGRNPSDYLNWLATASYTEIRDEPQGSLPEATLLYLLFRHALLQEYAAAASRVLGIAPEERTEHQYAGAQPPPLWPWHLLDSPMPGVSQTVAVGRYLDQVRAALRQCGYDPAEADVDGQRIPMALGPTLRPFAAFCESLDYLIELPAASLDALLRETLDLCSHRYDAWVTSFAAKRLRWLRGRSDTARYGIYLGGYGWLEDLAPGSARVRIDSPKIGTRALRVRTNGVRCGVYQHNPPGDSGAQHALARAWLRVVQGRVGMGTGNAGATTIDTDSAPHGDWQLLEAPNGGAPVNEFVIYATELGADGYTEFYVAHPSVSDGSTLVFRNSEFKADVLNDTRSWDGIPGGPSAAEHWFIWNNTPAQTETEVVELSEALAPPGVDPAPLHLSDGNHGYVHAPSLAHATTAAILRSGYASRRKTGDGAAVAINLSSTRVRSALWLLDGVRQGQSLGSLLGYRFERALHENHPGMLLDRYIPAFRNIAPSTASSQGGVLDGLRLLQQWKTSEGIRWGRNGLPRDDSQAADYPDYQRCVRELANLDDALDAVADLAVAESVHQVAQGKVVRAGATLDAIAQGDAPPPDLEVIRTPRTGIGITHRIAVVFGDPPGTADWGPNTPRAVAEPCLNAWASALLGGSEAERAACRIEYDRPGADGATKRCYVLLRELNLSAIDLVYLAESGGEAQCSELEQRIRLVVLRPAASHGYRPDGVPADAALRLTFVRDSSDAGWPEGRFDLAVVLEAARAARKLMSGARALAAGDLAQPATATSLTAADDAEPEDSPLRLVRRADAAVDALQRAYEALSDALSLDPEKSEEALTQRLLDLAAFGIAGSVPLAVIDDSLRTEARAAARSTLRRQAESVEREAAQRRNRVRELDDARAANPVPSATAARDHHMSRLREVFGAEFRVLPRFKPDDMAAFDLFSFTNSAKLQDGDPLQVVTWFQRIARVRDGAARLDAVMLYAQALSGAELPWTVGQLPYHPEKNERWVGLPGAPLGGRVSLVALTPFGILYDRPVSGLLVDEWVEAVPSQTETTGVAYHFDGPNSRPPQTILLAVAPDERAEWTLDTLEATVLETLELAKLRAVDLTALDQIGQFLPALYFARNDGGATTITTDFTGLAEKPGTGG